mmetsp:Transcript_19999/g.31339  ORF Transcript_19999/g.31339 Transcript_19999/m.31339 type:complete len:245 (-) Transcript_19999:151-885(-)
MIMFFIEVAVAADASTKLGKVDKSSLSQLDRMKVLTRNLSQHDARYLTDDVCDEIVGLGDWKGVTINTDGNVEKIIWSGVSYNGTVDLQWVPQTTRKVFLRNVNRLEVLIELRSLPDVLTGLDVSQGTCTSSVHLSDLPPSIEQVALERLGLTGTLELENLPSTLVDLRLSGNAFRGTVCLTQLPKKMTTLHLSFNSLCGRIDLTSLPPIMYALYLGNNRFEGLTDFSMLPKSFFHASQNIFPS